MAQASFGPHLDPERLGDRAARGCLGGIFDQITGCVWSIIVGVIVLIMILGAGGYAVYLSLNPDARPPSIELPGNTRTWDGTATLRCTGHEHFKVDATTASLKGTAILADDHCQLELNDVTVKGSTSIEASEHAVVRIKRSSLSGKKFGVTASGHAKVEIEASKVSGKTAAIEARDHAQVTLREVTLKGEARPVGRHARIDGATP